MRECVLVTGAAGRVGSAVVRMLAGRGDRHVVALLRRPGDAKALPDGVSHRLADYRQPEALQTALDGVDTLVFVSGDGEAVHVVDQHRNVIDAARAAGVGHIVYLSSLDADPASPFCYAVTNAMTERMLRRSGSGWTVVRASIFAGFFSRWPRAALDSGELRLPAGDGRVSLVTRDDVARALAALACRTPGHRPFDVTGPDSLDMPTLARRYGDSVGRPIRYVDIPPAEFHEDLALAGTDPWWAYAFSTMFASIREQRWAAVSDDHHGLTSRPSTPVTFG